LFSGETGTTRYGIWKARARATDGTSLLGRDFDIDLAGGDLVAGGFADDLGTDATGRPSMGCAYYADPDVVALPDGGYRLYADRVYRVVNTFPSYDEE